MDFVGGDFVGGYFVVWNCVVGDFIGGVFVMRAFCRYLTVIVMQL